MPELRKDPINGRWIIFNIDSPKAPKDYETADSGEKKKNGPCPFCRGYEDMTPPEIYSEKDDSSLGWSIRVVPNKFPALRVEGDINRQGIGMYDMMNGVGAHEVIIENPIHNKEISDLGLDHIERVIQVYRNRSSDLKNDLRFKYVILFKNVGWSSGASVEHPHTQLIALPMVPKNVAEEIYGAEDYHTYKERCVYCDIIRQELRDQERIIEENKGFIAFCPFVSRFPFEVWIMPKEHNSDFNRISQDEISDLARALKDTLNKINKVLSRPSYNYIVHSSPLHEEEKERDSYHWHIEIMPRLSRTAGFEWGSGFYVNPTPPEVAAKFLNNQTK